MPHELAKLDNVTPARLKRLEKGGVAPADQHGLNYLGVNVLQKNDPVLMYLALSDEREYDKMITTDIAISAAIEQRVNGLVSQGWEIVAGESQSPRALELADFVKAQFDSIPHFGTLRREMLRAIFYGWRPALIDWTSEFEHKGRPYFGIARIRAQKPWHYEFTADGDLLFTGGMKPVLLPDRLQWFAATAGSTDNPYGDAWLRRVWMLYFVSKKFEKMSAQAIQRSLGIIKAKQAGGTAGALAGSKQDKVAGELGQILDRLNSHNILMELNGWSLEFITDVEMTDSYQKVVELFDTKKRQAIVLQNLTSEIKGFGSRAAATEHMDILKSVWLSDAEEECGWYDDGVIKPVVAINFGQVDPEDMPHFKSSVFSKPDIDDVKAYFDMSGQIDGRRLAKALNIPAHFEDDDSPVVLEKQGPSELLMRLQDGGGRREDEEPPFQKKPDRAQRTASDPEAGAASADASIDRMLAELEGEVGDELRSYYDTFAEKVTAGNSDPKA